jgi:hypothetical protein
VLEGHCHPVFEVPATPDTDKWQALQWVPVFIVV